MKFKFFLGVGVSIFVGVFVALGVLSVGTIAVNYIKTQSYAIYDSANDLGAKNEYEIEEKKVDDVFLEEDENVIKNRYFLYENSLSLASSSSLSCSSFLPATTFC